MFPVSLIRSAHDSLDGFQILRIQLGETTTQPGDVTDDQLFQHEGRCHARQVGTPRCHSQGETQSDQIMSWVANHRLIEVADLNIDLPPTISATGPMLPVWQSPQIQISGPAGIDARTDRLCNHA